MSSSMYFGDLLSSKSQRMSSSTLSNLDKFFNLPTHASFSHFCPVRGISRCTDDCDLLPSLFAEFPCSARSLFLE